MNDERFMILQLLQDGKITKEEAEKLLDALNEGEKRITNEEEKFKVNLSKKKNTNSEETKFESSTKKNFFSDIEDGLDIFGDYVNTKINKITEEFSEEKLNNFNKKVNTNIEKIMNDITKGSEDISKSILSKLDNIMDTSKFKEFKSSVVGNISIKEYEKSYNFDAISNIEIENYYGAITLSTSDRGTLSLKIKTKYDVESEELFRDSIIDDLLKIKVTNTTDDSVDIELVLPALKYENIVLSSNGSININDINTQTIRSCSTTSDIKINQLTTDYCLNKVHNGNILLKEIKAKTCDQHLINGYLDINTIEGDKLIVNNTNGRITIEYGKLKDIEAHNSNGRIFIERCKADNISLSTSNKKIRLNTCTFDKLEAFTSNADIEIDMVKDGRNYEVDYFTSRGDILRENPDDVEIIEEAFEFGICKFRAKSIITNKLDKAESVFVKAKTSNGTIKSNI